MQSNVSIKTSYETVHHMVVSHTPPPQKSWRCDTRSEPEAHYAHPHFHVSGQIPFSLSFSFSCLLLSAVTWSTQETMTASELVPYDNDNHNNLIQATTTTTTLLPSNIANFVTAVAVAAKLSLRCSSLFIEALFEAAKYSTVFSFGLSRQALINAIATAKKLHALTFTDAEKY